MGKEDRNRKRRDVSQKRVRKSVNGEYYIYYLYEESEIQGLVINLVMVITWN